MTHFAPLKDLRTTLDSQGRVILQGFYHWKDGEFEESGHVWCELPLAPPVACQHADGLAVRRHYGWTVSSETVREVRLHLQAWQLGADKDTLPLVDGERRTWTTPDGDLVFDPSADDGEKWAVFGAGSYPLRTY